MYLLCNIEISTGYHFFGRLDNWLSFFWTIGQLVVIFFMYPENQVNESD